MPGLFQVAVKGVIRDGAKALLLQSEEKFVHWDLSGGRIEEDEPLEDAVKRELMEELPGIKNIDVGLFLYGKTIRRIIDNEPMVILYYRVSADASDFSLSSEHVAWKWVCLEDIDRVKTETELFPSTEVALRAALS